MNGKPIIKIDLPLYEMNEVERVINACKVLDYTGKELLEHAVAEFLDNHNL